MPCTFLLVYSISILKTRTKIIITLEDRLKCCDLPAPFNIIDRNTFAVINYYYVEELNKKL